MELKISDLPPQFENIAMELGIERAKLLFNSFIFELRELILTLTPSSFPSIRINRYIVTIAGNPKLATSCIKSSSIDIFLRIIFKITKKAPH